VTLLFSSIMAASLNFCLVFLHVTCVSLTEGAVAGADRRGCGGSMKQLAYRQGNGVASLRCCLLCWHVQVVANARALGEALKKHGYKLVTDGTDNHLLLWDLRGELAHLFADRLAHPPTLGASRLHTPRA
jgi:hypothetical protein